MISEKVAARLLLCAAQRRAEEGRAYMAAILPRSTPCDKVMEMLADAGVSKTGLAFLKAELPWLADRTIGESVTEEARDVMAMLTAAGANGIGRGDLSETELDSLRNDIAEFSVPTGGRPRRMVRLRNFDPRHNPYAAQAR